MVKNPNWQESEKLFYLHPYRGVKLGIADRAAPVLSSKTFFLIRSASEYTYRQTNTWNKKVTKA